MLLFCCSKPWICAFFKFRWSTRNMKKSIWPDLNSQVFKLTSLHPREENHPEMVNIARVFTFRSSHQHHCHSFRFSFEFAFFSLVSSTSSTSLAIWTPTWKQKRSCINCFIFNEKPSSFWLSVVRFGKDYEPPTNNTGHCTCGGYGCTSEPNPILTCQICWAIRKKKGLRLPEGCFRIAHMWLDEQLLFFLENSSPKITACWCFPWTFRVGNHKIFKKRQSWEKNQREKSRCEASDWFLFWGLEGNLFCHQKSQPIRLPPQKIWQPGNIPILLVAVVQQCCLVFNLPKSEVEDTVVFHLN